MALSEAIINEKNKVATANAWLVMLVITLIDNTIFRLVRNDEDITFTHSGDYVAASCEAQYKMNDDAADKVVTDSSPNGNNGASQQNTEDLSTVGKVNNALSFNGSSDYINIDDALTPLANTTVGTWSMWLNVDGVDESASVLSFGDTNGDTVLRFRLSSGRFRVATRISSINKWDLLTTDDIPVGSWVHCVLVQDGTSPVLYVNSSAVTQSFEAGSDDKTVWFSDYSTLDNGRIGCQNYNNGGNALLFGGNIDDVRFYSKALSRAEVSEIYNSGAGGEGLYKYTAFNFQLEPTELNSKGQIPTLTLRVSNVSFLLQAKMKELDGGIGSTVNMKIVNSGLLANDFSDLEMNFEVLAASQTDLWVEFILGAPSPLRQRFPLNKYQALHCNFRFESAECSYNRKVIAGVTLSDPVSIEVIDHDFEIDDAITLYTVNGITGDIEGNYLIKAVTDVDNVIFKTIAGVDVDGGDFGGSYTSGGQVGYTTCERTLTACRKRENAVRFGGFPGMRSGGVRIA